MWAWPSSGAASAPQQSLPPSPLPDSQEPDDADERATRRAQTYWRASTGAGDATWRRQSTAAGQADLFRPGHGPRVGYWTETGGSGNLSPPCSWRNAPSAAAAHQT